MRRRNMVQHLQTTAGNLVGGNARARLTLLLRFGSVKHNGAWIRFVPSRKFSQVDGSWV